MRLISRNKLKWIIYVITATHFLILVKNFDAYKRMISEETKNAEKGINIVDPEDQEHGLLPHDVAKENKDIQGNPEDHPEDINEPEDEYEIKDDLGPGPEFLEAIIHSAEGMNVERPEKDLKEDQDDAKMEVNRDFFQEREQVYRERRERVQRVCDQLGHSASYGSVGEAPLHRLRWLNSHKLIMCFNAKVGTSTWTQYLLEAGFSGILKTVSKWHYTAAKLLKPPQALSSQKFLALMDEYRKVMIVRHPFARIVSAYHDKIVSKAYSKLRHYIIKRYRPSTSSLTSKHPSFEEFVQYLVEFTPADDDIRVKRKHRTDRHWFSYYANCAPCDIHYDVIATMESAREDTRYVLQRYRLGLAEGLWNNHRAPTSSEQAALTLFKNLPRKLTMALHQRYRVDFLMFGYNVTAYLAP